MVGPEETGEIQVVSFSLKLEKKNDFILKDRTAHLSSMVQVSGDGVMLGYLNNAEANAKTFTEDGRWTEDHHDRNHLDMICHHHYHDQMDEDRGHWAHD